ncbi:INO80 complex subunit D-like protein [Wolffia australiana]
MGSGSETRPGLPFKGGRRAVEGRIGSFDFDGNHAGTIAQPSSSSVRPVSVEESEDDVALRGAEFLSRVEVTRRRMRRDNQLIKLYKRMYWSLMEEARVRYRNYYWTFGRSPVEEDESGSEAEGDDDGGYADGEGMGDSGRNGDVGICRKRDRDRCAFPGCKTKPMALTMYCHPHILSDPRQKLYKPCSFPIKSSQSGSVICGKPILCAPQLSYCPTHVQKAQKNVSQALKRAGLVHSSSRPPPKINVIITEYVRQIQAKRREARRALEEQKAQDDDAAGGEDLSGDD